MIISICLCSVYQPGKKSTKFVDKCNYPINVSIIIINDNNKNGPDKSDVYLQNYILIVNSEKKAVME